MPEFSHLLVCYAIAFGLANKVPMLHGKNEWLDKLLACTYCLGFHAGYLGYAVCHDPDLEFGFFEHLQVALAWALASAAFSYGADTLMQLSESWIKRDR